MDMLIKLYALPEAQARPDGVRLRKPIGPEFELVTEWVGQRFGAGWASEARAALANRPLSLFLAERDGALLGFACYDATARGLFGPIGVDAGTRGSGVGAALLRACLDDMRAVGYAYAVAGSVGPAAFFRRHADATEIADSSPGPYAGMLRT
jgi:predicted N-acetyltransferase YhbS